MEVERGMKWKQLGEERKVGGGEERRPRGRREIEDREKR